MLQVLWAKEDPETVIISRTGSLLATWFKQAMRQHCSKQWHTAEIIGFTYCQKVEH
jgi:hypothetical protein